ncbi:MAG: DUF296 domain-containing protein [Thermoleophilia bacterium]|nr:DUF296 domain-containing protein [Thermoleophilia bacterium]
MFEAEAVAGPIYVVKLPYGSDLLKELQNYITTKNITLASLWGMGAVSRAVIRYYDQPKKEWIELKLDKRLEVAAMVGNVSLLNGEPIVHVHVVLADEKGRCYGGHLADGTLVFNLEIVIATYSGPPVNRQMDPVTGLTLWQ